MKKLALLTVLLLGCSEATGPPSWQHPIAFSHARAGDPSGVCTVQMRASAPSDGGGAEWGDVAVSSYGTVVWTNSGENFWHASRIEPGEVAVSVMWRVFRESIVNIQYIDDSGRERVKIYRAGCV